MQRRRLLQFLAACAMPAGRLAWAAAPAASPDVAHDVAHDAAQDATAGAAPDAAPDSAPWQQLRDGGHVLLMRHAATDPGIGDPPGFALAQCATQRNLSQAGRRDAERLGAAVRAHGIPIGPVWSSRWCRCLDTARIAFGRVQAAPMLDSMFHEDDARVQAQLADLRRRLAGPAQPGNTVLVTHDVNIRAMVGEAVVPGEVLVARALRGRLGVVGRLRY